jgi:hypothetical protein
MTPCKLCVWLCSIILLLLMSACATPYQAQGARGGYFESQIDANTYRVGFSGNGFVPQQQVEASALYRCAELTKDAGYDYFVVLEGFPQAAQNYQTAAAQGTNSTLGQAVIKGILLENSRATVTIKMFKGAKPTNNLYAYNAVDVLQYLGPAAATPKTTGAQDSNSTSPQPTIATGMISGLRGGGTPDMSLRLRPQPNGFLQGALDIHQTGFGSQPITGFVRGTLLNFKVAYGHETYYFEGRRASDQISGTFESQPTGERGTWTAQAN